MKYKTNKKSLLILLSFFFYNHSFAESKLNIDLSNLFPNSINSKSNNNSFTLPDNKFFVNQCNIKPVIKSNILSNKLQYKKRPFLDTHWTYDPQKNHPYTEFTGYFDVKYDDATLISKSNPPYFCYALKNITINIVFNPIIFETEELFPKLDSLYSSDNEPSNLSCIINSLRQREQKPFFIYVESINNNHEYLNELIKNFEKESLPLFSTTNKENEYKISINNKLKALVINFQQKIESDVVSKIQDFIKQNRNFQSFKSCDKEISAFNIYNQSFNNFKLKNQFHTIENKSQKNPQEIFVIKEDEKSLNNPKNINEKTIKSENTNNHFK